MGNNTFTGLFYANGIINTTTSAPPIGPPRPVDIKMSVVSNDPVIIYTFFLTNYLQEIVSFTLTLNFATTPITTQVSSNFLGFLTVQVALDPVNFTNRYDIIITLNSGFSTTFSSFTYNNKDIYRIMSLKATSVNDMVNLTCGPIFPGVKAAFSRLVGNNTTNNTGINTNVNTNITTNNLSLVRSFSPNCPCISVTGATGTTRVPIIDILGETTLDGSYLSDFTWTIQDKYQYCRTDDAKDECIHDKINYKNPKECKPIFIKSNKLKKTTYFQYGPPMQDVVKGKGKNLREKLYDYYLEHQVELVPSFMGFYVNMIIYGMLKYVLVRILYGDFNIKYLCRNYNKKFFKDLRHSRFCGFIEVFENSREFSKSGDFEDPTVGIMGYQKHFIRCCI